MKQRTLATTVRCDARDAAMALKLFEDQNIKITSISELFRESVSLLAELSVERQLTEKILETRQAVKILQDAALIDMTDPHRPNTSSLIKALAKESKKPPVETFEEVSETSVSDDLIQEARKRLEEGKREKSIMSQIDNSNVVEDE